MAGETLPPIVAVLQGDVSDLVAKIALAKKEVESLDGVEGTATANLDFSALESSLAEATALVNSFGALRVKVPVSISARGLLPKLTAIREQLDLIAAAQPISIPIGFSSAQALEDLAAMRIHLELIAKLMAINVPVQVEMGQAVAEFIAGTTAMRAAAAAAGGGKKGGGLLAILGWGGGMFGGAAFGSVLSMAGFGFEHLATTVLGLAGSLAGALAGAALLAAGSLGKLAVGAGSDLLVMLEANQAIKALVVGLEAAPNATPTLKALAALSSGTLTLAQATTLYGSAAAQALQQTAKLQIATDAFWLHSIGPALIQLSALKNSLLGLAQTYIPLIAWAAQKNFAIINQAIQPLLAWARGPGVDIFKNLENLFAASIPTGVHALTMFVELLAKIANFAAPQTGSLMQSIDSFLTKLNTPSGFARLEGVMTTMIGMFRDWWNLLKQIGITIYDLFSQSVGLGTSIVNTITNMLKALDKWLTSTSGKASIHNLFQVHLQEVMALLSILPALVGAFGSVYLTIAPPLTLLVAGLATAVGWLLKLPAVGPFLAMAAAIAILGAKMKILALAAAAIAGIKNLLTLFQALGMGGSFKQAISIAFGSQSVATQMQAASDTFSAAVTRFAESVGVGGLSGKDIPGVSGGLAGDVPAVVGDTGVLAAGGLGASGASETSVIAGILAGGTLATVIAAAVPAAALAAIAYFGIQSIVKHHGDPVPKGGLIPNAGGPGGFGGPGGSNGIAAFNDPGVVNAIRVSMANAKAEWNTLDMLAKGGKQDWNMFFSQMQGELKNTLQSGSNTAIATNDLYQLFKAGKIKNAAQLQTWENDWNRIQLATGTNATFAQGLATNLELAGKLADKQVPAFISAFNTLVKNGMNPASITAVEVANQMALALATAANLKQTLAQINAAALLFATTNRLTLPHGGKPISAIPPKPHALGGLMAAGEWGTAGEGSATELLHALPGGGVQIYPHSQSQGMMGGGTYEINNHVQITMPSGVNLTPQIIANAVTMGLEQHDADLMRSMGMTPRVGAI